jgi:hypothetical protein
MNTDSMFNTQDLAEQDLHGFTRVMVMFLQRDFVFAAIALLIYGILYLV